MSDVLRRARADHPIEVRVTCDRCGRRLGYLFGTRDVPQVWVSYSGQRTSVGIDVGGRFDYFARHRGCKASPIVQSDRLVASYRVAAERDTPGARRIAIPSDLGPTTRH